MTQVGTLWGCAIGRLWRENGADNVVETGAVWIRKSAASNALANCGVDPALDRRRNVGRSCGVGGTRIGR
jgi:hypothetical protein